MSVAWVGAGIAAVGLGSQLINGNKAADAQVQAASDATAEERREFDVNQSNLKPFRDAGLAVLPQLQTGLAPGGQFNRNFTLKDFQADPGYQFREAQGQQALERSAAARGGLLNGGALKAITQFGQDFASNEYSNAYNRYNNDMTTRFNRLSALAGTGQTATNTIAQLGTSTAGQIGSNILGAGNATAAGYVNQNNAIGGGVQNLGNWYMQQQYLNKLNTSPVSSGGGAINPGSTYSPGPEEGQPTGYTYTGT